MTGNSIFGLVAVGVAGIAEGTAVAVTGWLVGLGTAVAVGSGVNVGSAVGVSTNVGTGSTVGGRVGLSIDTLTVVAVGGTGWDTQAASPSNVMASPLQYAIFFTEYSPLARQLLDPEATVKRGRDHQIDNVG